MTEREASTEVPAPRAAQETPGTAAPTARARAGRKAPRGRATGVAALVRMRLSGFLRSQRALAPLIAGLVVLGVLYGGGEAQAAEAYGVSAVVLFPVLAWQTKMLLDAEPDTQRQLALVSMGVAGRELAAGLIAAVLASLATVVLAMLVPWLVGGLAGPKDANDVPLGVGIGLGVWAHLIAVPAAVALGALASRAITRAVGYGVLVLVGGALATIMLGMKASFAPWLVAPVMATARAVTIGPSATTVLALTTQALVWSLVAFLCYMWLRRNRT